MVNKIKKVSNGSVYHINFGKTFHPELKSKHLGILFNIDTCNNMFLCLPMTSPKEKHFNSKEDYEKRNYRNLKYAHLYYLKETDSIVLLEQVRSISKNRVESQYKNPINNQKVIISKLEQDKLRKLLLKIINNAIKDE